MTKIKMLATDIDGTLVNDRRQLSDFTINTLKKAHEQGVKIVLCTGRPLSGVKHLLHELGLDEFDDTYVITHNGAQALNATTNKVVFRNLLAFDDFQTLSQLSQKLNVHMQTITTDSKLYVNSKNIGKYSIYDAFYTNMDIIYAPADEMPQDLNIAKIMWADDPEKIDHAFSLIPTEIKKRFDLLRSEDFFCEFMHQNASKGYAAIKLGEFFGLKPDEIMTAGDQDNDMSMIINGSLSIAMGNAIPKVKDAADYITDTNNNDGLAKAVEKFILNN